MIATRKTARILAALCALVLGGASCAEEGVRTPLEPGAAALSSSGTLQLVEGKDGIKEETVSAWIDSKGGELKVGGHMLSVSRHAVDEPTLFTMRVVDEGYVQVELTATRVDPATGATIDVGKQGFARPVHLKLYYDHTRPKIDPSKGVVAWLEEDSPTGKLRAMPTEVDSKKKFLSARLDHFSMYAVATS